jgi:hypothetical protein
MIPCTWGRLIPSIHDDIDLLNTKHQLPNLDATTTPQELETIY